MQHHSERVTEAIREELAEILGFEMADPRLASVDVVSVALAPGGRLAIVHVSPAGDINQQKGAFLALEHARNFLRHELASRLNLRKVPDLQFEPAGGASASERVEILLKRAKKKRSPLENQP